MKKIAFVSLVIILSLVVHAKKIAQLPELMKPVQMEIGKDRVFISEGTTIYIYSLKDYSLVKKFGKAGEGPREFKINPFGPPMVIAVGDGKLWVSSDAKLSTWTMDGEFIREKKVPPFQVFFPVKDRYVASGNSTGKDKKNYVNIALYDKDLKLIKELYQSDWEVGPNFSWSFPMSAFTYIPYKEKIYIVAAREGFAIDAYDLRGNRTLKIRRKYQKLEVPASYKNNILNWFKTDPGFKQFFEFFKQRLSFKSHFPPIQWMLVNDDRIYVFTFKQKNGLTECQILDLKGKDLKRLYLPLKKGILGNSFDLPIFAIADQTFYTIIENDEEEVWELHRVDLK